MFRAWLVCFYFFVNMMAATAPESYVAQGAVAFHGDTITSITIRYDPGGFVTDFYNRINRNINKGVRYRIDGACISACTLTLMDPNVCATDRGEFRFHTAFRIERSFFGRVIYIPAPETTAFMMRQYPPRIRAWIERNGGPPLARPGGPLLVLKGEELFQLVRHC